MRLRTLAGLAVAIVAGTFAVAYAPTNLGGHTTYVSTYGTSMLPRFHAGDLAVVQPASHYRVGEVVAYRSSVLDNKIVLHRIIAADDGHFTMKGDNNDFDDPVHPTASQIVGRLRARIPKGGAVRGLFARPLILFPLVAVAIGFASSGLFLRKKKRRSDSSGARRAPPSISPRSSRRRLHVVVPFAAAIAALGFVVAIGAVWRIPASEPATRTANYVQRLGVGYSGAAAKGAVYPDGKVHNGDPVFTRLVKGIDVAVDYDLTGADAARDVTGTYRLTVNVSSVTGWSSSFPLVPKTAFAGTHVHATEHLPIARLHDVEARVAAETGLDASQAAISIAPRVQVRGQVGTAPFTSDITTKLDFQLSPVAMTPVTAAHSASATEMAKNGSVRIATTRPGALSIAGLRIPAETAKLAVFLALALALAAAATILVLDRERVALGELAAIERRYGRLIIAVGSLPPAGDRTLVAVESMRSLAQLAQAHEQPIVRGTVTGGVRFALATDAVVYYYDATPAPSRPVVTTAAAA